ncbi:MAG: OmpA family protein [Myxococcales bacterium]|nr:OmpA family protein [Myxococcales bacterium]
MRRPLARLIGIGLGVLPAAVLLAGCTKYPSCKKDGDCRAEAGEVCVDRTCQNCATDADCVAHTPPGEAPYVCSELRCASAGAVGAAPSGRGEEGDPCVAEADCVGGLTCREGACSLCTADAECASGLCNPDSGRCSPAGPCQTDAECAMDEICDGGLCVFSGNLGEEGGGPCGLAAVFFAFDDETLTPKAQQELVDAAACITQQGTKVFLEAHADDRGTEEYNILLTERRGIVVRTFLSEQGVPGELMQVVAKGSLEAAGTDESSRARDRRVAFIWPQ